MTQHRDKPRPREFRDRRFRANGRSKEYKHLYDAWWRRERATFLKLHPLCAMCQRRGDTAAATEVDHIIPHRGDVTLFRDPNNWQGLCKPDHDSTKAFIELHGYTNEIGADGWPIDPMHPVNRPRPSCERIMK